MKRLRKSTRQRKRAQPIKDEQRTEETPEPRQMIIEDERAALEWPVKVEPNGPITVAQQHPRDVARLDDFEVIEELPKIDCVVARSGASGTSVEHPRMPLSRPQRAGAQERPARIFERVEAPFPRSPLAPVPPVQGLKRRLLERSAAAKPFPGKAGALRCQKPGVCRGICPAWLVEGVASGHGSKASIGASGVCSSHPAEGSSERRLLLFTRMGGLRLMRFGGASRSGKRQG